MAASNFNRKSKPTDAGRSSRSKPKPAGNSRKSSKFKKAHWSTSGSASVHSGDQAAMPRLSLHRRHDQEPRWVRYSDSQLLEMQICDLDLDVADSPLVDFRDQLYGELAGRNLKLKPHCWFSDDWFSPDGVPGIAIPFYMAHRRLMRLERKQMLEVEGGTKEWCLQILRHEAGHAIDTAFRLHRRKGYREIFGNYSAPYPETYRPKPRSKKFVLHLAPWYAQSHPAEDFAETFAVWLTPGSRWKKDYQGWSALKKLQYVDDLMREIAGKTPPVSSRARVDSAHRLTKTLREHYEQRQATYCVHEPSIFDDDLRRLFLSTKPDGLNGSNTPSRPRTAAAFLQKHRRELCQSIAHWTGEYRYNINQVLREMIERCRALQLYVDGDESQVKQDLMILLTMHTMKYLHAGHRVAL